jgi:ABC-type enterobactin transport system permease subunit
LIWEHHSSLSLSLSYNFVLLKYLNIKMDLLEIGLNVVDWIGLAQDRYRWRALVGSVMNLRVP